MYIYVYVYVYNVYYCLLVYVYLSLSIYIYIYNVYCCIHTRVGVGANDVLRRHAAARRHTVCVHAHARMRDAVGVMQLIQHAQHAQGKTTATLC